MWYIAVMCAQYRNFVFQASASLFHSHIVTFFKVVQTDSHIFKQISGFSTRVIGIYEFSSTTYTSIFIVYKVQEYKDKHTKLHRPRMQIIFHLLDMT